MSSSHPAPEDAAPPSALTQHGSIKTNSVEESGKRIKTPRPPPRSKSASLLTQALATNYETEEDIATPVSLSQSPEVLRDSANGYFTVPHEHEETDQRRNDLRIGSSEESGGHNTMTVAAVSAGNLRANDHDEFALRSSLLQMQDLAGAQPFLLAPREFNPSKGRGTSLERTDKERKVESPTQGQISSNPGDTGLSGHVTPQSPATPDISMNPPTEGMRARYRSWRDARPVAAERAWSIGQQSSDDSGQVENSIKEALAGIEPNNRSRKASHSMRFFKEGLPEDKSKRKESKVRAPSKDARNGNAVEGKFKLSLDGQLRSRESDGSAALLSPRVNDQSSGDHSSSNQNEGEQLGYFDLVDSPVELSKDQVRSLPAQLLADIRKNHNLTPGARKGTSFSQSIPVTASEKSLPDAPLDPVQSQPLVHQSTLEDDSDAQQTKTDEDEDSGSETIFSAVFLPHQKSHEPESIDDEESGILPRPSAQRAEKIESSDSQQWLEEHEVPLRQLDEKVADGQQKSKTLPSPRIVKSPNFSSDKEYFTSEPQQVVDIDRVGNDRASLLTNGDNSYVESNQDSDTTPKGSLTKQNQFLVLKQQDPHPEQKQPLDAIELIPYRHQVGGHTTMWRFSKRAVCKQLNNRENEFYEKVERLHPKLCKFLPRYIGVLNVSFFERQRRKATKKEGIDGRDVIEQQDAQPNATSRELTNGNVSPNAPELGTRVISQSIQASSVPIPTVTFAANRHIIPKNLLRPLGPFGEPQYRSKSDSEAPVPKALKPLELLPTDNGISSDKDYTTTSKSPVLKTRPTLEDKHSDSWGSTIKNKELRNKVFDEVFSRRPIPVQHHKKAASQRRTLPNRGPVASLRASISESSLASASQSSDPQLVQPGEESMRRRALKAAAEMRKSSLNSMIEPEAVKGNARLGIDLDNGQTEAVDDKTGTSAPEYDLKTSEDVHTGKHKRRYSSGGLRRKPTEVAEDRGNLKYFEEADDAGYKGDGEEDEVFAMDLEPSKNQDLVLTGQAPNLKEGNRPPVESTQGEMVPSTPTAPEDQVTSVDISRPVNPKEAQAQQDARVVYFLLLEDLTAGMKKPCIMDLKMGTRQYGVDANEKKQKSQRQKCELTTSRELGVRVCGLQVWDAKTQTYIFQDKYFGRDLRAGPEFQNALQRFLYDGVDFASALRRIPVVLKKLAELEVLIATLAGYRFYAASLLMFYDGDNSEEGESDSTATEKDFSSKRKEIDFKIADFANCVIQEDDLAGRACPPRHPDEPDRGFLRGLRSLRLYFRAIQKDLQRRELGYAKDKALGNDGTNEVDGYDDEGEVSY